jgi:ABC-type uncharacterized transport system ATPase subunit
LIEKIKQEERIFLILENINQPQIESLRNLQGILNLTEANEELLPNQTGLCIELKTVDKLPQIFDFLFNQKIKLVNFKREEPTLEDAFIELTKRASP